MPNTRPDSRDHATVVADALAMAIDRLIHDEYLAEAAALLAIAPDLERVRMRLTKATRLRLTLPAGLAAFGPILRLLAPVEFCTLRPA